MHLTASLGGAFIMILMSAAVVCGQIKKPDVSGGIELPAGARINVRLDRRLDSNRSWRGERFTAMLVNPVCWGRYTVFPAGSLVHGVVAEVKQSKMRVTNASITLVFDRIETPDGRVIPIAAIMPDDFDLGAALGKGGSFLAKHVAKKAVNTMVGGWLTPLYIADYARRGVQFVQKDKDVVLPKGTVLQIYLERPVRVPLERQ